MSVHRIRPSPHPPLTPPLDRLLFFFFNAPPTPEIYTLSLHDALPIPALNGRLDGMAVRVPTPNVSLADLTAEDRKSTRLNSSHSQISYAVFCLKKKKNKHNKD